MTTISQDARPRNSSRSNSDEVEPILISEWPLSRGEIARVSIRNFKGSWLIDIRKWFETGSGELRAGPKGISLSLKHLRRISVATNEAIEVAQSRGLLQADEEGGR
jgi:Transcriptional Coactivator p15 (PC4)